MTQNDVTTEEKWGHRHLKIVRLHLFGNCVFTWPHLTWVQSQTPSGHHFGWQIQSLPRSPRTDSSSVSSLTEESDVPVGRCEKADDGGDDGEDAVVEHGPNGDDSCSEHAADQDEH